MRSPRRARALPAPPFHGRHANTPGTAALCSKTFRCDPLLITERTQQRPKAFAAFGLAYAAKPFKT